jgi:serine/threonine protein kinase/Tol biopolymer transport system component
MKPEGWQQLDQLFHSASEYAPAERAAFLDYACNGDDALRKEVEALIAAHEGAGSFIEGAAMEVEARELAADEGSGAAAMVGGETVSHYRIISLIGSGGMGEVYLAEDTVLSRRVALKLLPEYFSRDRDRLRRFQQEARAASALNHPNIITIFEIGEFDGRHFITTEFIDGRTLRQHFFGEEKHTSRKPLPLREVLDIAIQTADALAAAHEAHIVHRDIKPENIMLRRRDGYVKVLDFGLAKLTEGAEVGVDPEGPTKTQVKTSAGVVMGTASYMSPEQARGEKVDVRTDIWSLGVVVYEMVAGSVPFERSTPSEVIALILEREPPPLARYAREAPAELERIVNKALTKDREERYQTAKDLLVDLRRLRQRLEVEAEIERTAEPQKESSEQKAVATGSEQQAAVTGRRVAAEALSAAPSTSSAEHVTREIRRHKRVTLLLLTVLILALAAGGYGIYRLAGQRNMPVVSFQGATWKRLTSSGKVTRAAISPDGNFVAHVVDDGGRQSLRVRQIVTKSNIEVVAPDAVTYQSLTFTPDGNHIYYILQSKDMPDSSLYQVSTLGRDPKRLPLKLDTEAIDLVRRANVSFSPDGKRFVFSRIDAGKEAALVIANADGSGEQKLVTHRSPEVCGWPAWSPDGKTIAYAMGNEDSNDMTVFVARIADGTFKPLASQRWLRVQRMAWLSDGSGLLVLATAAQSTYSFQIWYLSYPGGEARRVTNELNNYVDLSLTEDSSALATVQFGQQANLWIAPAGEAARARQITFAAGGREGGSGISWTPDGRIVYSSVTVEGHDIWIINADGTSQRQLTNNSRVNRSPAVTPDGRYIFFLSDRTGVPHIWRMDLDGGDPKQLTNGAGEQHPDCSPDGRWVIYQTVFGEETIWRVSAEGGEPVKLTGEVSFQAAAVSPDSKLIAHCIDKPLRIAITPFEGGAPLKAFDVPPTLLSIDGVRWTPDGRAVAFIGTQDGVSKIWAQPLDGGAPKQLVDFKSELIFWFGWSRDGKQLALSRGTLTSDVVLISNFR